MGASASTDAEVTNGVVGEAETLDAPLASQHETAAGEADANASEPPSTHVEDSSHIRLFGQHGTLYFKLGGAPGIAAVLDFSLQGTPLVEATALKRNHWASSKAWGHNAVSCGLRFLLIRLVSSRAGGPQNHSEVLISDAIGVDINVEAWRRFCQTVTETCHEFKLAVEDTSALTAVLVSMEEDVATMGATGNACRDAGSHNTEQEVLEYTYSPRAQEQVASQSSHSSFHRHSSLFNTDADCLYMQVGGMMPLAFFAQKLLDAVLAEPRMHVSVDEHARNKAALRHFFTELMCYAAGGPEVMTARDLEQTRLLLPHAEWYAFRTLAETAANHIPRSMLLRILRVMEQAKDFIIDTTPKSSVVVDANPLPLPPKRLEDVRRILIERGLPPEEADALLGLTAMGSGAENKPMAKASHSHWAKEQLEKLRSYDPALCCPITLSIYTDPVVASDGNIYERSAIGMILRNGSVPISPLTRGPLQRETYPLHEKKLHAREYRENVTMKLLEYAEEERDLDFELAVEALEEATEHLLTLGPEKVPALATRAACLWQGTGQLVPWELQGYGRGGTVGICVTYGAAKAAEGVASVMGNPLTSVWSMLSSAGSLATGVGGSAVDALVPDTSR